VRALKVHVAAQRREPVAEAPVDPTLRGPERRERLAPLADVVQLDAHQLPEDPAAAVRGQDADDRDARRLHGSTRDGELELERARAADDRIALEGDVQPALRQHVQDPPDAVGVGPGRGAEVVPDRLEALHALVACGRTNVDGAQRTFSSGA
jgi:hypothetical protein